VHVEDLSYQVAINLYSIRSPGIKKMADVFYQTIHQQILNG
jgi:hypothetical protein